MDPKTTLSPTVFHRQWSEADIVPLSVNPYGVRTEHYEGTMTILSNQLTQSLTTLAHSKPYFNCTSFAFHRSLVWHIFGANK